MSRELDINDPACRAELVRLTVTGAIGGLVIGTLLGETRRFTLVGTLVGTGLGVLSCTQGDSTPASSGGAADDDDDDDSPLLTRTKDGTAKPGSNKDGGVSLLDGFTVLAGDDVDDYSFTVEGAS